jgi:type IV pilus assembly protein PilV
MNSPQKQHGLALIESLVSLLILALGVLGLLGVQLRTLAENQTSTSRLLAGRLADDLFERLKTNPDSWTQLNNYVVGWGAATPAPANCGAVNCTPLQRAQWDMDQWKTLVAQTLPAGQATAFVSPTDARQLGVMLAWRANEQVSAADYINPFNVNVTDGAITVACPANLICHIAYAQP